MNARHTIAASLVGFALLLTAGCGKKEDTDADLAAAANGADPALTGALEDQIMVDPALTAQANGNSARPTPAPRRGELPGPGGKAAASGRLLRAPTPAAGDASSQMTLGELARVQGTRKGGGCDFNVAYSAGWANRLPATFPLYPDAQVMEAAGKDTPSCHLRVVTYRSPTPLTTLVDWYYTQAVGAGFSAEHRKAGAEHRLAGAQEKGAGAYYVFLRPAAGGTEVDFVTNQGI